jgi:hypothetical protein
MTTAKYRKGSIVTLLQIRAVSEEKQKKVRIINLRLRIRIGCGRKHSSVLFDIVGQRGGTLRRLIESLSLI